MNFLKLRAKQVINFDNGIVTPGEVFEIPDGPNFRFFQRAGMAEAVTGGVMGYVRRFLPDGPPAPASRAAENRRRDPHDFLTVIA